MAMLIFQRKQAPRSPAVTIRKRGSLSFNAPAVREFPIKDKQYAILHFDSEENIIGIQPINDRKDLSAFPIAAEKNRNPNISCQAFLRHCGVPFKEGSKVYPATWDPDRDMIIVHLS